MNDFQTLLVADRIGIGTERPEPETQLHISPTNKDGKIYLESGGNLLQVTVNSTIATIGTSGNRPLQLQANLNQSKFSGIYISDNGNVGIGTTSPSFNLDVQGTINATQFNKNGKLWKITDDDIDDNTISGKKIKPRSISQDRLDFTPGGSQWVSGSSSSISYNSGNVGIGNSNPSFNLDVAGIINATQFNKNGQRWKITDDDIDDNTISGKKIKPRSISQDRLDFTPGGSQWVDGSNGSISYSNGNVGLGKSPSFNLDVQGTINATQFNKNGKLWKITDDDIDGNTISGKKIKPRSISQDRLDFTPGGSQWVDGSNGSISYSNGNVGIGTITPKSLLEIRKDVQAGLGPVLTLQNGSGQAGAGAAIDFNGYDVDQNPSTARIQSIDDGNFSSHIAVYTKEPEHRENPLKERLRIQSNGNVGIGTQNPQELLDVAGIGRFQNLYTLNSDGNRVTELWRNNAGAGFIGTKTKDGTPAVQINTFGNSDGSIQVFGGDGKLGAWITGNGFVGVYDKDGQAKAWMSSDGSINAVIKNFVIPHPQDESKNIIYAAIEGPECAAYIRGKATLSRGQAEIVFPDHFSLVVNPTTLTIQLTPRSAESKGLAVIDQSERGFSVRELWQGEGEYEFDYFVAGVRQGLEDFSPVVTKGFTAFATPMTASLDINDIKAVSPQSVPADPVAKANS
ncbi:MAG: hypothetical protein KME30_07730 [Iphinoe sp. HA4291-MV1]|nr:hypothetical protein [Iphinoe sp. HA4291-MV1]